jgi:hypothetical protein
VAPAQQDRGRGQRGGLHVIQPPQPPGNVHTRSDRRARIRPTAEDRAKALNLLPTNR